MPKRSTGCFECRKRKVRCDEARPECHTCLRRGTKCPGYRPTQSFILHTFDDKHDRPAIIREDEERYRYANHRRDSPTEYSSGAGSPEARAVVPVQRAEDGLVEPHVPRQVSPVAIDRVQHLGTFLSLYLPKWEGEALPPPSALVLSLPTLPASSHVLLASVDALSAAQLAVNDKNLNHINRSRSLYGTALSQMMKAIQTPKTALEDETLLATYLLTLYEVFVGVTNGHGFFYHVQGLLHCFRQRGPSSFNTRLSMQIFHAVRYNSLSIGYQLRKASMLDTEEWLSVTSKAAKVDPYVALLDIVIHIPRLLERTDALSRAKSSPTPPPDYNPAAALASLVQDSQALAARAFAWFASYERNGPRYNRAPLSSLPGFLAICNDHTFDPIFHFRSFATGICYMIYWMSMLILQSNTFGLLMAAAKARGGALEPKQLMLWDRELSGYADSMCRAVPFSCRPEAGYTGRFGTLTPLVAARKFFEKKGMQREIRWCEVAFYGTKVEGLYSYKPAIPIQPNMEFSRDVQGNKRYI